MARKTDDTPKPEGVKPEAAPPISAATVNGELITKIEKQAPIAVGKNVYREAEKGAATEGVQ